MLGSVQVYVRVLVVAYCVILFTESRSKQLYEVSGNTSTCKQTAWGPWTCKLIKDCPKAVEVMRKGQCPQMCDFKGAEPLVCCEPEVNNTAGAKSKTMCEKYAEAVYIVVPDLVEGGFTKYDTCAIRKTTNGKVKRLINGTVSLSREFPHAALIGSPGSQDRIEWFCSGSLISDRYILTSGVCVTNTRYSPKAVRLGDFNYKSDSDEDMREAQASEYHVTETIIHPEYKRNAKYNDIALLKLNSTVLFTEFIRPICLHTQHEVGITEVMAAGWGKTFIGDTLSDILQTVNLTIYPHKECVKPYKEANISALTEGILDASMICAGDREGYRDTCHGDSGAAIIVPLQDPYCMYSLVGITSFGVLCTGKKPAVFTRVSHFVPWIESIVWP